MQFRKVMSTSEYGALHGVTSAAVRSWLARGSDLPDVEHYYQVGPTDAARRNWRLVVTVSKEEEAA